MSDTDRNDEQIEYTPISVEEAVKAVKNGRSIVKREIDDLRKFLRTLAQETPLNSLFCSHCLIRNGCDLLDLEIKNPSNSRTAPSRHVQSSRE